jgi:hypothetical protein
VQRSRYGSWREENSEYYTWVHARAPERARAAGRRADVRRRKRRGGYLRQREDGDEQHALSLAWSATAHTAVGWALLAFDWLGRGSRYFLLLLALQPRAFGVSKTLMEGCNRRNDPWREEK